jgi:hypothetical protein
MASNFNFDSLDKDTLEATVEWFRANPEPPADGGGFQAMLDDALDGNDWMDSENR